MFDLVIQALINGVLIGGIYALVSVGFSLCLGVMDLPNLAQPVLAILGSFVSYFLVTNYGVDPLVSLPISFIVTFIAAALIWMPCLSRMVGTSHLMILIATLSIAIIIENAMVLIFGNEHRLLSTWYNQVNIPLGSQVFPMVRLLSFLLSLGLIGVLSLFLKFSYVGKAIRALAQNRNAAQLVGVNVKIVELIAFCISVGLAGCAGTFISLTFSFFPSFHWSLLGILFPVVVIGGLGRIDGIIVSSLLIGVCNSIASYFLSSNYGLIITYVIMLLTLLIKPKGLFGGR